MGCAARGGDHAARRHRADDRRPGHPGARDQGHGAADMVAAGSHAKRARSRLGLGRGGLVQRPLGVDPEPPGVPTRAAAHRRRPSPRQGQRGARTRRTDLLHVLRAESGTYPELARIVRVLCAVAGRCCQPLAAAVAVAVAVTVAVSRYHRPGRPHRIRRSLLPRSLWSPSWSRIAPSRSSADTAVSSA